MYKNESNYYKLMFNNYKQEVLHLANTEAGRYLLSTLGQKPEFPIIDIGKDCFIEDTGERTKDRKVYKATFYSRIPIKKLFVPTIEKVIMAGERQRIDNWDEAFLHFSGLQTKSKFPQIFLNETTFNPNAHIESTSVDGIVYRGSVDETLATIRSSAGTTANDGGATANAPRLRGSTTNNKFNLLSRGFYLFDTSALTVNATITAATISLNPHAKANGLGDLITVFVSSNPATDTELIAADYATIGSTSFNSVNYTSWTVDAYTNRTLNASGIANVSKTGISKYGLRSNWDYDNFFGGVWVSGGDSSVNLHTADNGSDIPKLTVTFTLPGGAFIFNL